MLSGERKDEVLRLYGLACFYAQCVEVELDLARYFLLRKNDSEISDEKWLNEENKKLTMGTLLNIIKNEIDIKEADIDILDTCLKYRNFLSHAYWIERTHLVETTEGCLQAIDELEKMIETLYKGNNVASTISVTIRMEAGISEALIEDLQNEYVSRITAGEEHETILQDQKDRLLKNRNHGKT